MDNKILKKVAVDMGITSLQEHSDKRHKGILIYAKDPANKDYKTCVFDLSNPDIRWKVLEHFKFAISWFKNTCVLFDKYGDMLGEGKTLHKAVEVALTEMYKDV